MVFWIKIFIPLKRFYQVPTWFEPPVSQDALIDIQIKRIHEYKRRSASLTHLKRWNSGKRWDFSAPAGVETKVCCLLAWFLVWRQLMNILYVIHRYQDIFFCGRFCVCVFSSQFFFKTVNIKRQCLWNVMDRFLFVGMALHVRITSAFLPVIWPGAEKEVPCRTAKGGGKGFLEVRGSVWYKNFWGMRLYHIGCMTPNNNLATSTTWYHDYRPNAV